MPNDIWTHCKCPICGKEFHILSCEDYTWKFLWHGRILYFCSYTCRKKGFEEKRNWVYQMSEEKVARKREIARRYYHNKREKEKNECTEHDPTEVD